MGGLASSTRKDVANSWLKTTHASDYHPQLAVGAADGTCMTTNMLRSSRRGGIVVCHSSSPQHLFGSHPLVPPFLQHKIFQLDFSRATNTYRMLERFLPQETPDRSNSSQRSKKGKEAVPPAGTGAWTPNVGVVRVAWNTGGGLGAASLLASGTAAGLGRVDRLEGIWLRNRIPYTSVQAIRMENSTAMDVDDDVDSS